MKALIVIDMQKEYSPAGALPVERFSETVGNVAKLMAAARNSNTLLINVRHISRKHGDSSFDAGSPMLEFIDECKPLDGEIVLTKHYPGSFSNPELDRALLRNAVDSVVICGLTSFLCCDSTAREAFQLGYEVLYVEDAISEFGLGSVSAADLHSAVNAIQGVMFSSVLTAAQAISYLNK